MLLSDPDVLVHLLPQLTRQDAIRLSVTCDAVHQAFVELQAGTTPLYSPAPRVIICASDSQQLLLMPLSPDGQPYYSPSTQHSYRTRRQTSHKCQLQAIDGRREGREQWLTGVAFSPYDHALYVAAYGEGDAPASIFRFSPGHLRPAGSLVSGSALYNPEGLAFAKQACYVVCAAAEDRNSSVLAVDAKTGSTLQRLELSGDAAWGMAAWDPSTYPAHRIAAEQAAYLRAACGKQQHNQHQHDQEHHQQQQQQQHQHQHQHQQPHKHKHQQVHPQQDDTALEANRYRSAASAGSGAAAAPGGAVAVAAAAAAAAPAPATAAAAPAAVEDDTFRAQAAQGCLLVAVQGDVHKDDYWQPPVGPASGTLLCVPLSGEGRMSAWREWSRVKIKRPSGITFDHAGHVWTTSLGRKLLRLAGPCHPNSGTLLQTVDLVQLLPPFARQLYPMDVQAAVQVQAGGSTAGQRTAGVQGHCGVGDQDPTPRSGHAMLSQHTSSSSSLMVVTLHSGSKVPAAVAVLRVHERVLVEGPQHDSSGTQEGHVCLVNCWQDRLLQQPNMVAIQ